MTTPDPPGVPEHVKMLRQVAMELRREGHPGWPNAVDDAIDEIDRLRAELVTANAMVDNLKMAVANREANYDALRAELERKEQRWFDSREYSPPKNRRILMAHGYIISSGQYREGRMGEPTPSVIDWRCDCCGRYGKPTQWIEYVSPPALKDSP